MATITTPTLILVITDHLHLWLCLMSFQMGVEAHMDMVVVVHTVGTVGMGSGEAGVAVGEAVAVGVVKAMVEG